MRPIHLVRHGQAEWQLARAGDLDSPLTQLGHRQARTMAGWVTAAGAGMGASRPRRLFTSPLLRARQTSAYLAEAADLREEVCGDLAEAPFRVADHLAPPPNGLVPPPGDYAAFRRQVARAFALLCAAAEEGQGSVFAVTHGGVIRTMLDFAGHAAWREIPNASVTVLARRRGTWRAHRARAFDPVGIADETR